MKCQFILRTLLFKNWLKQEFIHIYHQNLYVRFSTNTFFIKIKLGVLIMEISMYLYLPIINYNVSNNSIIEPLVIKAPYKLNRVRKCQK